MTTEGLTAYAKLLYQPKDQPSTVNGVELAATAEIGGEKVKLYWKKEGLRLYLAKGDVLTVVFKTNKWRIADTQTPELSATLKSRMNAATPAAPTDAPTTATRRNGDDVAEMAAIAQQLAAALPDWTEQAIASLACTVFIQRGK